MTRQARPCQMGYTTTAPPWVGGPGQSLIEGDCPNREEADGALTPREQPQKMSFISALLLLACAVIVRLPAPLTDGIHDGATALARGTSASLAHHRHLLSRASTGWTRHRLPRSIAVGLPPPECQLADVSPTCGIIMSPAERPSPSQSSLGGLPRNTNRPSRVGSCPRPLADRRSATKA